MQETINDKTNFKQLEPIKDINGTIKIKKMISRYLKDLYGLPQLHKMDIPLRPIMSMEDHLNMNQKSS